MKESSKQFEEAMKKLETIVGNLEGEELSLDDALKKYEEGIKLVRFCTKKLEEAQKKIEILSRDEDKKIVKKPYSKSKLDSSDKENKKGQEEGYLF